jgi:DNA anti-recombination protein RmuC
MDSWNDERLDEMSRRMDEGFRELREEIREGFARVDNRFEQVDRRFERLYYVMITASVGLVASVLITVAFG